MLEKLYTAQEVADMLHVKPATVFDFVRTNKLCAVRTSRKFVRFTETEIKRFIEAWQGKEAVVPVGGKDNGHSDN